MWKVFLECLCIFIAIGNLSALNVDFNCCDIYEIIIQEKCINLKQGSWGKVKKLGFSLNFQCNIGIDDTIMEFAGSLSPQTRSDSKECFQEPNSTYRQSLDYFAFKKYTKDKQAVCKPHIDSVAMRTDQSLEEIRNLTLEISSLNDFKTFMNFSLSHATQLTGVYFINSFDMASIISKVKNLYKYAELRLSNGTQSTGLYNIVGFNRNFMLRGNILSDLKGLRSLSISCSSEGLEVYLHTDMFRDLTNLQELNFFTCAFINLSASHFQDLMSFTAMNMRDAVFDNFHWLK